MMILLAALLVIAAADLAVLFSLFWRADSIIRTIHDHHHDRWQAMGRLHGFDSRFPSGRHGAFTWDRLRYYGFLSFPFSLAIPIPDWIHADRNLQSKVVAFRRWSMIGTLVLPTWVIGLPVLGHLL